MSDTYKLVEEAKARCRELDIEKVVRRIARSGNGDTYNHRREFDGHAFSCTCGAGTNSTQVKELGASTGGAHSEDGYVYYAIDYGKHISAFREGPWVTAALAEAARLESIEDAKKAKLEGEEEARVRRNFSKIE